MKNIKRQWLTACMLLFATTSFAQKGSTRIQLAAQASIPMGDLASAAKVGRGFAIKGLWGFSNQPQQITLEAGNNFFSLRDKYVIKDIEVNYSAWPIYLGYRRYFKSFYAEGQAGFAITKVVAFLTDTLTGSAQETHNYFAWAMALGYKINDFNLEARYQSISVGDNPDVNFVGLRIAYSLPFFKRKETESK